MLFCKCIKYWIFWNFCFQMGKEGVSAWISLNHLFTNFKTVRYAPEKPSGCGTVNWFIRLGLDPTRGKNRVILHTLSTICDIIDVSNKLNKVLFVISLELILSFLLCIRSNMETYSFTWLNLIQMIHQYRI